MLQNVLPYITVIGSIVGFLGVIVGGTFAWINRKPDRSKLVIDGAWKLKGEAERQLADALTRIAALEARVRDNENDMRALNAAHAAALAAQERLHQADLLAKEKVYKADMEVKDRIIVRLEEKVDALVVRLNEYTSAPITTVSTTETRTVTNPGSIPMGED